MSRTLLRSVLPLAVAALPAAASAQAAASRLDEVVITGSRLEQTAAETPYDVEVLGPDIVVGRRSLADALAADADIYVQAPGGRGGVSSLFLRGADPNFTTVLFDGVALNNPTDTRGGAVNVSGIGIEAVDRVEVVTGALSSLYGSGGLAGGVNLVVPGGTAQPTLRGVVSAGTDDDLSGALSWRGPLGGGYGASLTAEVADAGDETPGSSFSTAALTARLAPLDGPPGERIVLRLQTTEARGFPDNSGGARYAALRDLEHRHGREALIGAAHPFQLGEQLRLELSGDLLRRRDRTETPGVAPSDFDPVGVPAGTDDTRYWRAAGRAILRLDAGVWRVLAGAEAQQEDGRSRGELALYGMVLPSGFDQSRTTYSAFAEAAHTGQVLSLDAGVRVDDVDRIGSHLTARGGARLALGGGLTARASLARGFKAPSLYALGNPFVGNPDLKPEKSRSAEVALDWRGPDGLAVSGALFHSRFQDLIDFDPGPPPQLANRSRVTSKGASVRLAKTFEGGASLSAEAVYDKIRDTQTDESLLNRPKWRTAEHLSAPLAGRLTLGLRHSYIGRRFDYSTPTGPRTLGAYHLLAADLTWAFRPQTSLAVLVDNALDETYEDAVGFEAPGRRARLQLRHSF